VRRSRPLRTRHALLALAALSGACFGRLAPPTFHEAPAEPFVAPALTPSGPSSTWIAAYYNGVSSVSLPASEIDYAAFTHLFVFALLPTATGGIDDTTKMHEPAQIASVAAAARAAGKKVLVTIGGASSHDLFASAISDANRAAFVAAVTGYVAANGYDGVDLDMEPLGAGDASAYRAFVSALRSALPADALLTAATITEPDLFASLQSSFDRVDLMTYHFVPHTPGLVWHNAALYSGGAIDPTTGDPLPSCDASLARFVSAGVDRGKLGIGIDFNGEAWTGASQLGPSAVAPTSVPVTYAQITDAAYPASAVRWDPFAQAPYVSLPAAGAAASFVSYDDAALIGAKLSYARTRGLGSVILWSLQAGYRADRPEGARQPLLEAVKAAAASE
jgi:chitinase